MNAVILSPASASAFNLLLSSAECLVQLSYCETLAGT